MKRTMAIGAFVVAGLVMVRLMVGGVAGDSANSGSPQTAAPVAKYTCSMHPQLLMDHPDLCPLCGMDLTPVRNDGGGWEDEDPSIRLVLSDAARKMADVGSVEITRRELFKEIRTVGRVDLDETRVADVAARLPGPISKVFADSSGTPVKEGDPLVSIFSIDVYPAQQAFLFTRGQEAAAEKMNAGTALNKFYLPRRRLEFFGMTDEQLEKLLTAAEGTDLLEVSAPISGTIIKKNVRLGQFVQEGDVMFTIADLSQVWLNLEIYESEISWLRLGQPVEITLESEPHRPATGKVGFIEPTLNEATRTVRVRVILDNPAGRFKPGMYAQALLRIPVLSDGSAAPSGLEGKYLCTMHPFDVADEPGACVRCGMALQRIPGTPADDPSLSSPLALALPAEAVLTTGRRQLAYLEVEPGKYRLVEPKLGPRTGDYYPVISGFKEGDRVVTRGSFLVDSQFQITGKSSLIYSRNDALAMVPDGFTAKEWANYAKLPEAERQAAVDQKTCPGCGMNVAAMGAPVKFEISGRTLYLCCKGCANSVKKDPDAAFAKIDAARSQDAHQTTGSTDQPKSSCCGGGKETATNDATVLAKLPEAERQLVIAQQICPPCGMQLVMMPEPYRMEIEGRTLYLCGPGCEEAVRKDPAAAFAAIEAAKLEAAKQK